MVSGTTRGVVSEEPPQSALSSAHLTAIWQFVPVVLSSSTQALTRCLCLMQLLWEPVQCCSFGRESSVVSKLVLQSMYCGALCTWEFIVPSEQ